MEEIIKLLDKADSLIREELKKEAQSQLPNASRRDALAQAREHVQKAISIFLSIKEA